MKKSGTVKFQEKSDENRHCEPERQRGRSNHGFEIASLPSVARNDDEALPRTELLQKSGITLVEMIVAMLLSTVIVSALACQFVAMVRFNTALQNTIEAERDAYTIVNNMTRILRFADPATFSFALSNSGYYALQATIKAGHLSFITVDTPVTYGRGWPTSNSFFVYRGGEPRVTFLSNYVSDWDATSAIYDPATRELSIAFSITKTSASGQTVTIPISTKIKVRGDL